MDISWNKIFLQASYTWAQSKGNTEGGVKSDIGQGDTSVTQDFDYKELTVDTYGFLPNDRRHSLKVFGNYEFTDEWSIGANLLVQSGRPINCFGTLDLNPALPIYEQRATGTRRERPHHHQLHSASVRFVVHALPEIDREGGHRRCRRRAGSARHARSLALDQQPRPELRVPADFVPGLQFKLDVFNVFNHQKVTSVSEVQQDGCTGEVLQNLPPADVVTRPRVRSASWSSTTSNLRST